MEKVREWLLRILLVLVIVIAPTTAVVYVILSERDRERERETTTQPPVRPGQPGDPGGVDADQQPPPPPSNVTEDRADREWKWGQAPGWVYLFIPVLAVLYYYARKSAYQGLVWIWTVAAVVVAISIAYAFKDLSPILSIATPAVLVAVAPNIPVSLFTRKTEEEANEVVKATRFFWLPRLRNKEDRPVERFR